MLILIASDDKNLNSKIAKRFGHANYYILFDSEKKSFKSIKNIEEGHNHDTFEEFINNGVKKFIVGNIGPNAFEVINKSNTEIYLAIKMTVQEAINKLINKELERLWEPTVKSSIGR